MNFVTRVLELIDKQGITKNKLLVELNLSKNSFVVWGKGAMPNSEAVVKIADYFNVSTDYLLGRTDYPEINNGQIIIDGKTIEGTVHEINGGYILADPDADITPDDIKEIKDIIK